MQRALGFAALVSCAAARSATDLYLNMCSDDAVAFQSWTQSANGTKLTVTGSNPPFCMDITGPSKDPGAVIHTWQCGSGTNGDNENWAVTATAIASTFASGLCVSADVATPAEVVNGTSIVTGACTGANAAFAFSAASGRITHIPSGLCVDYGSPVKGPPFCSLLPQSGWPFCDPTADINARAADIVSRLTLADKIRATVSGSPSLPSVGLPAYQWWSEATHGISGPGVHHNNELPGATNTALPITTSCSFNRSLWKATGNAIAREGRAYANVGMAGLTFWTPVINIVRDPRWGRNIESAGEDPFTSGQYAANFIQGFEHATETPYPLQASTCCKHFVANELEHFNNSDRQDIDVYVPQQDLVDSYLPSFQTCVEEGQASGIMCSYNSVNGQPSCANEWLLKTVLRDTWQFDGYVTSDCDAEGDTAMRNRYPNSSDAVAAILKAGTDVDCGGFMAAAANRSINDGTTTEADFDVILRRQFRLRIRLGMFDPAGALETIGLDQVCTPASDELARDGVRQSVVLAKNTGNVLPLNAGAFASALVAGPLATSIGLGTTTYYGSVPCVNTSWAPIDAISMHIASATAIAGVPSVSSGDTSGVAAAAAAAATAPLVVLAIGSDLSLEGEGHDRLTINISSAQLALVAAVTDAAKGPVVALVFSGGAMDISPLLANPKVAAILICGQPSVHVVGAGDVLFGKTLDGRPVAPAARMSQMTYPANYVDQVSMFDFGMRPGPSAWPPGTNPGRTYRFYTGTPVLPFGYGLSYTTWTYTPIPGPTPPTVSLAAVRAAAEAHALTGIIEHVPKGLQAYAADFYVNVTNTGTVDSDDVVLGFLVPPGAGVDGVPLQELFGFERVFVPAGQTVTVYLGAQGVRFTQAGVDGVRRVLAGEYVVRFGVRETAAGGMGYAETRFTAA